MMNIIAAIKVVCDDQDITVAADGTLDTSKAPAVISSYDLNALEAAAQLAQANEGSHVTAVSVSAAKADDSKLKKNICARGVDELVLVADDAAAGFDSYATANALGDKIAAMDGYDVVICGDGSADIYAQQVDVQLACKLGVPSVNGVTAIEAGEGCLKVTRKLEDTVEHVEIPCPCVISVTPDIALPRIPGMKDILKAGKKPMDVSALAGAYASATRVLDVKAPEQAARKLEVMDAADDGAVEKFAAALKAAL